jgi:hypothetical protein
LVEVLLTLALLVLVSTVLISATAGFFQQRDGRPDDAFWSAVNAARQLALDENRPVSMRFDAKEKRLIWSTGDKSDSTGFDELTLRFLPPERSATLLLSGVLFEGDALARVRFYPDGTCDPFRLELKAENGTPRLLRIDPWTCAPVLRPAQS